MNGGVEKRDEKLISVKLLWVIGRLERLENVLMKDSFVQRIVKSFGLDNKKGGVIIQRRSGKVI